MVEWGRVREEKLWPNAIIGYLAKLNENAERLRFIVVGSRKIIGLVIFYCVNVILLGKLKLKLLSLKELLK